MVGEEPVHIDVWGCCTSRDIFAISENDDVKVVKYYQLPLFTQLDNSEDMLKDRVALEEISAYKSNYANRMAKAELNREVLEGLLESDSEWIVIDVRFYTYIYYEVKFNGSSHYYSRVNVNGADVRRSVEKKGFHIDSFNRYRINEEDVDFKLDEICDFLKGRYGRNIILVQIKEAARIVNEKGEVVPLKQTNRERSLLMEDELFNRMLDKLDCFYIKCPDNVVSEHYHKWGSIGHGMPVHYSYEYYDYASRCVDIIISGAEDWLKRCDRLYTELSAFYNSLIHGEKASIQNIIGRIEARLRVANTPKKVQKVVEFAEGFASDPNNSKIKGKVFDAIADIYLGGKYPDTPKKNEGIIRYLELGTDAGISKNRYRLFDALWNIGTEESYAEAVRLVKSKAEEGDPEAMYRFGRALRFGKGVPMDKEAACDYLHKASAECKAAREDYYTMVWNLRQPELFARLFSFLIRLETRDALEDYYLGAMFRTGKGCTKNLDKALSYLNKATELQRARRALFETLCEYNDKGHDDEAFRIAKTYASEGDPTSMRCLSWSYC